MQAGSGPDAWYLLQNLLPEVDLPAVQQATDQEVDEKTALGLLQVCTTTPVLNISPTFVDDLHPFFSEFFLGN